MPVELTLLKIFLSKLSFKNLARSSSIAQGTAESVAAIKSKSLKNLLS